MRLQFDARSFGQGRAAGTQGALTDNPNKWKSQRQQQAVLKRLQEDGHQVDQTTPPARCWDLMAALLLEEMKG